MAQGWDDWTTKEAPVGASGWAEYPANPPTPASDPLPPAKAKVGDGKRLRLETAAQIRREMARTYKQMKSGELDVTKATKMIYALTELSRAIERETVAKLAERLDEVEGK